jgi:hypothetical protein
MPSCRVPIVLTLQIETPRLLAEALAEVRQLIREIGALWGTVGDWIMPFAKVWRLRGVRAVSV